MNRHIINSLATLLLVVSTTWAQLAVEVNPTPARVGDSIKLTLTASGKGVTFLDDCIVNEVRAGTRSGYLVWTPDVCADVAIQVGHGQSLVHTWDSVDMDGAQLPVGSYWLRMSYGDLFGQGLQHQWINVHLSDLNDPALVPQTRALLGGVAVFTIEAPAQTEGFYVAAASLSTNEGQEIAPGLHMALDNDLLFQLSLLNSVGTGFNGFQGQLNASGGALLSVAIPHDPALEHVGFYVQAVVVPNPKTSDLLLAITNPVPRTIRDGSPQDAE